jgi:hypothetical protein
MDTDSSCDISQSVGNLWQRHTIIPQQIPANQKWGCWNKRQKKVEIIATALGLLQPWWGCGPIRDSTDCIRCPFSTFSRRLHRMERCDLGAFSAQEAGFSLSLLRTLGHILSKVGCRQDERICLFLLFLFIFIFILGFSLVALLVGWVYMWEFFSHRELFDSRMLRHNRQSEEMPFFHGRVNSSGLKRALPQNVPTKLIGNSLLGGWGDLRNNRSHSG